MIVNIIHNLFITNVIWMTSSDLSRRHVTFHRSAITESETPSAENGH